MAKMSPVQARRLRQLKKRQVEYPRRVMMFWKNTMRDRIKRNAELVDFRAFRGDLHIHSIYSDGVGTVDEIKDYADSIGLDFLFVTDHGTIRQKRNCLKHPNVWWGQEPGTEHHHLGILDIDRKYIPKKNLVHDYNRVKEISGFSFIPHPTGWFPTTRYTEEQKQALNDLGEEFAMEIINGANQIFNCFDITDAMAIELWDQHLAQGKRVTGLGCTDAHLPQAVGDVWTGVLCAEDELTKEGVLEALRCGRCFVSDAPLARIEVDGARMGETVRPSGGAIHLRYECADHCGLSSVRIIKKGRIFKEMVPDGKTLVKGEISDRFEGGRSYYRLECLTVDARRAYTNPIYIREAI